MSHRHGPLAPARRLLPLAALAALLLAACGPSPSITLQLGGATVQVLLGGSASTDVTLTRLGGASADVTLDADGAPDWVSVSFAPATLTGGTLTSTLTLEADAQDPDAEPTSFTLTVTAVGSGLTASDEVDVEVTLLTVRGRVTGMFGEVIPGSSVSVNGGTPIPVDSLGAFEGPDVAVPYDLVVLDPVNDVAHLYLGLSTTDLVLPEPPGLDPYTTTVTGDLSEVVGTDQIGIVCMEGTDRVVAGCDTVLPATTGFSVAPTWYGTSTVSAYVHAWVVDVDGTGAATGFAHEGRTAINLADGVPTLADIALGDGPAATTVEVSVTPPPGVPLVGSSLFYRYSEFASMPVPAGGTASSYTAVMPDVPGATAVLMATAFSGEVQSIGWTVGEYGSGDIAVTMAPALTMVAPADATVDVGLDTQFSVNNPSGSAVTFLFSQQVGDGSFLVTTADTVARIPDLSSLGMPLPSGVDFSWQAFATPHLMTVDDLVREGWVTPLARLQEMTNGGPGPAESGTVSFAGSRDFTTQ